MPRERAAQLQAALDAFELRSASSAASGAMPTWPAAAIAASAFSRLCMAEQDERRTLVPRLLQYAEPRLRPDRIVSGYQPAAQSLVPYVTSGFRPPRLKEPRVVSSLPFATIGPLPGTVPAAGGTAR